jgi:hypothetical protein
MGYTNLGDRIIIGCVYPDADPFLEINYMIPPNLMSASFLCY